MKRKRRGRSWKMRNGATIGFKGPPIEYKSMPGMRYPFGGLWPKPILISADAAALYMASNPKEKPDA